MIKSSTNKFNSKSADNAEERGFNFGIFLSSMKSSILKEKLKSDIDLRYYLIGYDQLYNFFLLLGGAFQFVAADVKSKIRILQEHLDNELKKTGSVANFSTVKTMVSYEKTENLLHRSSYVSGCRTLLRLHRGLDFFRKFLREIYELDNQAKLTGAARQVYDQTLAEYHTFIVRNSAKMAMQFLPTRSELLNKISYNNKEQLSSILQSFPDALETLDIVYDIIQSIFIENDLLQLP